MLLFFLINTFKQYFITNCFWLLYIQYVSVFEMISLSSDDDTFRKIEH